MAIKLKIKIDGKHKEHTRPNTNVLELEEFEEFQNSLGDIYKEFDDAVAKNKEEKKREVVSFYPYRKRIRDAQIKYIQSIFEDYDAFTIEDFKQGVDSEQLDDVIVGIFSQISPADFEKADTGKSNRSR